MMKDDTGSDATPHLAAEWYGRGVVRPRGMSQPLSRSTRDSTASGPRMIVLAGAVAAVAFVIAGVAEAWLIDLLHPTVLELDWISDAILSVALGTAVYLWLHLRATRLALVTRERAALVLQTELTLAASMQRRLLPAVPGPSMGVHWAAALIPAGRIGGDFFDFFEPAPGVRLMLIADVSGKGIPAALALPLLRATFRAVARETDRPSEIAARLSATFHDEWHGTPYVTALIARVNLARRCLAYTNAGHPRGIRLCRGEVRDLTTGGPPLGLLKEATFADEELALADGDVCVFVTDGVSEALDNPDRPWHAVIADVVARVHADTAGAVCRSVVALAQDGRGPAGVEGWTDDRTVVVLRIAG